MEKYIGKQLTIIYEDTKGAITKRRILLQSIQAGKLRVYDFDKRAPRVFDRSRILAYEVVYRVS